MSVADQHTMHLASVRSLLFNFWPLALTLVASCSSPTNPSAAALPPITFAVGREWRYYLRDSVAFGPPAQTTDTSSASVRVLRDTLIAGTQWFMVENGGLLFGNFLTPDTRLFRSDRTGVWWLVTVGARPAEILALPGARVGAQSPFWTVTRADVRCCAAHCLSATSFRAPVDSA